LQLKQKNGKDMDTHNHIVPDFTINVALAAILIAFVFITLMSFVKEPYRQKINALLIAGAGAVYWSGGLGVWEFVFGSLMLFVAYKGLKTLLLYWYWLVIAHRLGHTTPFLRQSDRLS
jgi:hypothetical protein